MTTICTAFEASRFERPGTRVVDRRGIEWEYNGQGWRPGHATRTETTRYLLTRYGPLTVSRDPESPRQAPVVDDLAEYITARLTTDVAHLGKPIARYVLTSGLVVPAADVDARVRYAVTDYAARERPVIKIEGAGEAEQILKAFVPAYRCTACDEVLTPDEETVPTGDAQWAHRECMEAGE